MVILGNKGLSAFVRILLDLIFAVGIIVLLGLPWCVHWYARIIDRRFSMNEYVYLMGLLYVTGILALWIVLELRKIFRTLAAVNPFLMSNVKSLNRMGLSSLLITLFYITKLFFLNSFMTPIIVIMFLIAGLFCLILAEVFRQATILKEENDFTI